MIYPDFTTAIKSTQDRMENSSHEIHTEKWQSTDISKKPEAEMREVINVIFQVLTQPNLETYRLDIKPNLPWADNHFEQERVSGEPINPGQTWKDWPYSNSADKFRTEDDKFSHTYAERYWPKRASDEAAWLCGIRYKYGDLSDVVTLLEEQPQTRQAYLPVWFPEDTGVVHGERVPCTLGYHFMMRKGYFHVAYFIRSCDFVRHFRDDLYLTMRLHLWVLDRLRERDPETWATVKPGIFTFWAGSLHMFVNDYRKMFVVKKW